ncbi:hypothetical protein IFM89_007317, partial [Coptis chinensis]
MGLDLQGNTCCCVVDMLARLWESEGSRELYHQMLFDPDIVVFKTLLAACRNRGDVEVAKRRAAIVNRGEVARVRRLMRRGVRKVPRQSRIEVKNRVNVFSREDEKTYKYGPDIFIGRWTLPEKRVEKLTKQAVKNVWETDRDECLKGSHGSSHVFQLR